VRPFVEADTLTPSSASAPSITGVRVIVVDDEADVRGAVAGLIRRAGAEVLALESGASIDAAIADFQPHVLVLDIGMPGEDGYSLIRRIRRLARSDGGDTPAISLTAHARDEDRQRAMELGFQAHLSKPVNVVQLLTTISRIAIEPGNRSRVHPGAPTNETAPT
jgi:CheY-like chemotaxis protein